MAKLGVTRVPPLLVIACLALAGCGSAGDPADGGDTADDGDGDGDSSGDDATGAGAAGTSSSGTGASDPVEGSVGVVVIDVQETFVDYASNGDMDGIIDRTKTVFSRAAEHGVPFFITFEASQSGDHALHAPLSEVLPSGAQDFVKTTFAATGLPSFADALGQSGVSHLVVLGAETDVCVLQTVLGLRAMGFTVLLQEDAVFSSETNTSPALRRMQQAGAIPVDLAAVEGFLDESGGLPAGSDAPPRIVEPLKMGVVLNAFTNATVSGSDDALSTQKAARLRELLLVSEWFDLPVYVADVSAGLPSAYASYYQGALRPMTQIGQDGAVAQLVVAGTDAGLADALASWMGSHQIYVMEDALLTQGSASEQVAMLQPFFEGGLVPITYKSFYYDMTKSVDTAEWPSQDWVAKFDEYYWITQAPEDLPPIPGG